MTDKTVAAVSSQIQAMGCEVFEVGLFDPNAAGNAPAMIPRTWDAQTLIHSVPWLRHQNLNGRNIYVRPKGEHKLSLVDDLTSDGVQDMKVSGFTPAIVLQTSPGNFQVWVKHPETLDKETGTAVARALAQRFGGDPGAADWRHFGRLAGYTNRKEKYKGDNGLYPFVRLIENSGVTYEAGPAFLASVRARVEKERIDRARISDAAHSPWSRNTGPLKGITEFRADARYAGDGTRVDLAYAIYAFSHGIGATEIIAALRSRDLSHKGSQKRQDDYIWRTIRKAAAASRCESLGR